MRPNPVKFVSLISHILFAEKDEVGMSKLASSNAIPSKFISGKDSTRLWA